MQDLLDAMFGFMANQHKSLMVSTLYIVGSCVYVSLHAVVNLYQVRGDVIRFHFNRVVSTLKLIF